MTVIPAAIASIAVTTALSPGRFPPSLLRVCFERHQCSGSLRTRRMMISNSSLGGISGPFSTFPVAWMIEQRHSSKLLHQFLAFAVKAGVGESFRRPVCFAM